MIFIGDELPCMQCDVMFDIVDLDDIGFCPDCGYENRLVLDTIKDQPEWVKDLNVRYISSSSISS
jgi:hypothetical protein